MTAAYLEDPELDSAGPLNMAFGTRLHAGAPLLVIAGAGSGRPNTWHIALAHLIVNGAHPRRILLMTFSRRAAAEMTRGWSASRDG